MTWWNPRSKRTQAILVLVGLLLTRSAPAAAATGFDSAYAGQSAFVKIQPGATANFQVFFVNTGTLSWGRGSWTQVDLAACLEDKTTCNAQDASEAAWNSGWPSATRYATTTQVITAPGSIGTFSYNIKAPIGVAPGVYRFNGDLVVSATGEKINPEGYYQEASAVAAAATIDSLSPNSGTADGGTAVAISGAGIVCTPTFPTVSFDGARAIVTRCESMALTVWSPAHAFDATTAVSVTVTNSGSTASNGLPYTYADTRAPILIDARLIRNVTSANLADVGDSFTLTFSEKMSAATGTISIDMACGANVTCTWNAAGNTLTVTVTTALTIPMQIPFSVLSLDGFSDLQGNPPNVAGSLDRLIDSE